MSMVEQALGSAGMSDQIVVTSDGGFAGGVGAFQVAVAVGSPIAPEFDASCDESWEELAELGPTKDEFIRLMHEFRKNHESEAATDA